MSNITVKQLEKKMIGFLESLNKKKIVEKGSVNGETVISKVVDDKDGYLSSNSETHFKSAVGLTVYNNTDPKKKVRWPTGWKTYTVAELAEKILS